MVSLRPHLAGAIGIVALLAINGAVWAADTDALIDKIISHQSKIRTWQAEFTQIRHLPSLKKPLRTPGKVWFQHTGEFRWELGRPARSIAIRSQQQITILSPRLKLAEVYPLTTDQSGPWRDALALLEVGFPSSRSALEQKFVVKQIEERSEGIHVVLLPRKKSARQFLGEIRMEFGTTNQLSATEMSFSHGARIRTEFSQGVSNEMIEDASFDASIPSGFRVSHPLNQP